MTYNLFSQQIKCLTMKKASIWSKISGWFYNTRVYRIYQYSWLYNLRWFVTHWYRKDNWVKTNLPIGYHDKTRLMEDALFSMVDDFMSRDGEDAPSLIVIAEEDWVETIVDVLHFYHIEKPLLEKQHEDLLHEIYGDGKMYFVPCEDRPEYYELEVAYTEKYTQEERDIMRKDLHQLEKKIFDETQDHLKKCIDLRPYLWS